MNLNKDEISHIIRCMDAYKGEFSFSDDEDDRWYEHDKLRNRLSAQIGGYRSVAEEMAIMTIARIEEERAKDTTRKLDYRVMKEIAKNEGLL